MEREQYLCRRALMAVIAAAYRVVEVWEEGDLAGRVTALDTLARHWDAALGLGVAGRTNELDDEATDAGEGEHDA